MRDITYCGPVPANEDCEQVGPNYRPEVARAECERYRNQLRRQFGPEPEGASLRIKSQPHDFGSYLEVVCSYDDSKDEAIDYAFRCEGESWPEWREDETRDPRHCAMCERLGAYCSECEPLDTLSDY